MNHLAPPYPVTVRVITLIQLQLMITQFYRDFYHSESVMSLSSLGTSMGLEDELSCLAIKLVEADLTLERGYVLQQKAESLDPAMQLELAQQKVELEIFFQLYMMANGLSSLDLPGLKEVLAMVNQVYAESLLAENPDKTR